MDTIWRRNLARSLSAVENRLPGWRETLAAAARARRNAFVIGITGPPGGGKSTLVDVLAAEWARRGHRVGVLAVDPASPFSGGAVLGDRVRMRRSEQLDAVFIRSMSARGYAGGLGQSTLDLCAVLARFDVDRILVETVGVGQNEIEVAFVADCTIVVTVPGLGDSVQAAKAGLTEVADLYVVNKADMPGAGTVAGDISRIIALVFPGRPGRNRADADRSMVVTMSGPVRGLIAERYGDLSGPGDSWHPPVMMTMATQETDAASVCDVVEDFRRWLEESEPGRIRRLRGAERYLRSVLQQQLLDRHLARGDVGNAAFAELSQRIAEGCTDAHAAADELLKGGPHGP